MVRADVIGVSREPRVITLMGTPMQGHMLRVGQFTYPIKVVEWVANADRVRVYVGEGRRV